MKTLNLDILINTAAEAIKKDVNHIFSSLLNEIQNYLDLAAINPNVTIKIVTGFDEDSKSFFSFGVKRILITEQYQIEISEKKLKFIQLILLREAYLCFVPNELRQSKIIHISILEIIENDLSNLEVMNEWKKLVRRNVINYDFLSSQFDKLDKFFKLKGTQKTQSTTQFFFEFIRTNISLNIDKMDDFYDKLYEDFIYKTSKSLYNDEIIETIRVLIKIFYQVKLFKNYSDFEEYFQEFKDKGIISTYLSRRKFSENLRWINKCTIISPSYQPIYPKINIAVVISILKFNPILHRKDIYNILDRIPFLYSPVFARNGFSEEIHCYFKIPNIYIKDLMNFLESLNNFGYIINKECYILQEHNNFLNLNYFREYFKNLSKIINPNHKDYDNRFELICSSLYNAPQKGLNFTLLEWIIFERVGQISFTGFGFERREETLQSLKDEILNHVESERVLISSLKHSLSIFYESPQLKKEILDFIENNKKFGFFYICDMVQRILSYLELIEEIIKRNKNIKNSVELFQILRTHQFNRLEENLTFKDKDIQLFVFRDIIPIYFKSFPEYLSLKERFMHFHNFFETCRKLKIFNINSMKEIIKDRKYMEYIYSSKEKKVKQSFEKLKPYKITNQSLDSIFKRFVDKELIIPELIDNIITSTFAKYHPILLLKDSIVVSNKLKKILKLFPRVFFDRIKNLFTNKSYIMLFTYFLNIKEKESFCSILFNIFDTDFVSFKRYFTSGIIPFVLIKDFYDFNNNEFFYTKDLFEQSFLYVQKKLGDINEPLNEVELTSQKKFWSKEKNVNKLIKEVDRRVSYIQSDFDINIIKNLIEFHEDLNSILLNQEKFKHYQSTQFYKNFVNIIKFRPNFQDFGLNQFLLYIRPSNVDEIDFRHFLINSFQSIKYPIIIDKTNSFLIKYIFPYNNPNIKHLNWYTKTKHIIREYCLFSIKNMFQILNFNFNIGANGWNYDSNRFKTYLQNNLFNPDYKIDIPKLHSFKTERASENGFFGPNSTYFQALSEIYSLKAIDLKSFLGTRKYSTIDKITELLKNDLIVPFISLKNLNFQDKIHIILPNLKEELNRSIIKIFNFFNYGFIYVIEGEYYIHGFAEPIRFENGLMIKLYFPGCEVDEFLKIFDLLFEYLEIDNYIVLTDLTNGRNLLKEIYGNLDFLESYNPLINLIWNENDKIWMNHKIYTEKFEKIYPDLYFGLQKE